MGVSNGISNVDCVEMEVMLESELMGMALGLFLGISVMGYIVWLLLQEV